MQIDNATAEKIADAVLRAAGSGFQHYMPYSKEKIITATKAALELALAIGEGEQ